MPSHDGDDKPRRPSTAKGSVRRTRTGETLKAGNSATARSNKSFREDDATKLPRKPIRERSTDQPLTAPSRAAPDEEYATERRANGELGQAENKDNIQADEALKRQMQQQVDEALVAEPTLLQRRISEDSNLQRREQVMTQTVLGGSDSYHAEQRLKASLRREQQEQEHLLAAKASSRVLGDEPDVFVDEHDNDPSEEEEEEFSFATPDPPPNPTRQSPVHSAPSGPGAYQGMPGEHLRRNASNWKASFVANQTSAESSDGHSEMTPYDAGDHRPPPPSSLHTYEQVPEDELLAKAQPVDEEEDIPLKQNLESARPAADYYQKDRQRRQQLQWRIGGAVVVLLLLILGLVVGLVVHSRRKDPELTIVYQTPAPSPSPTNAPTPAPTLPFVEGLPDQTWQSIQGNQTSPQARAYQWIGADPNRTNNSFSQAQQRFALACIYFSTNGTNWTNSSDWMDYGSNECDWFSTTSNIDNTTNQTMICNSQGDLLHLSLVNNALEGSLPPQIGLLTALEELDVSQNQMQGILPSEVGLLTNLTSLVVSDNSMAGALPTQLGLLSLMEEVHVSDNNFQGSLPTDIGQMKNVTEWDMKETNIGGPIPSEIGNWNQLKSLRAWNTALTGTLPSQMGQMTSLTYLAMHNGVLEGQIPTEFGLLSELFYLQMDALNLTGTIPSELGLLEEIGFLSFGGNQLVSTIPTELGLLPRLQALRFYQNQLTGTLPAELEQLGYLQRLELDNNELVGMIPSELAQVPFLSKLFLASNQLTGSLPSELGGLTYLAEVTLMKNPRLGGSIPGEWENLATKSLRELFLNGVGITGTIPSGLCGIDRLALDCDADVCGCNCQACNKSVVI